MAKEAAPPLFSVNVIVSGEFYKAGSVVTPFKSEDEVPETLKPFLVDEENKPSFAAESVGNFEPGVVYQIISDGRRGRAIANQAAQLQQALEFRDLAEQAASEPLAPEIQAALQSEHDLRIGKALAQARYAQEAADSSLRERN